LPDAFVVTPATAAIADSGLLEQRLSQLPGIESIESDPEWSRRWSALLERAMVVVLGAGVLAGLAMVAICYSTVRLQVLTYSERSVVMRLFGATSGQIRRPFMYFGAIQGLVSGIVAVALLDLVLIAFEPMLGTLIQQYGGLTGLSGLSWADQASVVLISIVGGAGGAWLASRGY
jgi:cell division transport system permease protein